jgi:hypothetical protein
MKKLFFALALLLSVVGGALAKEPLKLSGQQMDKVTAGWGFFGVPCSNASVTVVTFQQVAAAFSSYPR